MAQTTYLEKDRYKKEAKKVAITLPLIITIRFSFLLIHLLTWEHLRQTVL